METVSKKLIYERIKRLVERHKKVCATQKKTVNYGEVMDLNDPHFKFWCKEDVAILCR